MTARNICFRICRLEHVVTGKFRDTKQGRFAFKVTTEEREEDRSLALELTISVQGPEGEMSCCCKGTLEKRFGMEMDKLSKVPSRRDDWPFGSPDPMYR